MRLLLISSEFPPGPGGIGTHAFELARGLTLKGWEVTVLAPQDYVDQTEAEAFNRDLSFEISALEKGRWRRVRQVREVASRVEPVLVIASGATPVMLAASIQGATRVAIGHGSEFTGSRGLRRGLTRRAFKEMDAVVCVSRYTQDVMLGVGIEPTRRAVIPNGADATRFYPRSEDRIATLRQRLGLSGGGPILLTVGHVSDRKGQDIVIRALPDIVSRYPDAVYLIAGLPTRAAEYEEVAATVGVDRHVRFLGRIDAEDLPTLYSLSNLFVLVSRDSRGDFEGYGIAVVEAALCGKPTIASLDSGLMEAVLDGETGLLVPQEDPQATAAAVLQVLEAESVDRAMGRAARRRALREQTWEIRIEAYDAFLRETVRECA